MLILVKTSIDLERENHFIFCFQCFDVMLISSNLAGFNTEKNPLIPFVSCDFSICWPLLRPSYYNMAEKVRSFMTVFFSHRASSPDS